MGGGRRPAGEPVAFCGLMASTFRMKSERNASSTSSANPGRVLVGEYPGWNS